MTDHTIAHELIHAYDQCRVKMDRSNCLHVACTEVGSIKYGRVIDCISALYRPRVRFRSYKSHLLVVCYPVPYWYVFIKHKFQSVICVVVRMFLGVLGKAVRCCRRTLRNLLGYTLSAVRPC